MTSRVGVLRSAALAAVVGASLTAPTGSPAARAQEDPRPNVLVIVTDDQRWDAMDHMPATRRWFVREGTKFKKGFATTPFCCPSRASIITGKYAHNHGIVSGFETDKLEEVQETSIQKALKEAGYRTALFGKFLNAWPLERDPSYLDQWGVIPHISPDGYYSGEWNVNGSIEEINEYSTLWLGDRGIDFITGGESNDDTPWFLYIAPAAAHSPFDTEPRYSRAPVTVWKSNPATKEQDRTDKPPWIQSRNARFKKGEQIRRRQLRTLMSVDDMVGKLFRKLEELGETDTLAIFTSDNGYMWSEHGVTQKRYPYLPSVHVPYLARWPGRIPANVKDDRIVANIDIAPTIAEATGTTFSGFDGKPWLGTGPLRDRLLLEFTKKPGGDGPLESWASTLTPDYEYTEYYDAAGQVVFREYFDLLTDPWQLQNTLGDSDPLNDPNLLEMQALTTQLNEDRSCQGPAECP